MTEPTKIWVDRSRHLDLQRCRRLRFLGYHAGSQHLGLSPVRKSIHLVLGGAVHAGLEVLLREGQRELDSLRTEDDAVVAEHGTQAASHEALVEYFFRAESHDLTNPKAPTTMARRVENEAVLAALTELAAMTAHGVELDDTEKAETAKIAAGVAAGGAGAGDSAIDTGLGAGWDAKTGQFVEPGQPTAKVEAEPMLEITFPDLPSGADTATVYTGKAGDYTPSETLTKQLEASLALDTANTTSEVDWSKPVYLAEEKQAADETALEAVTLDTRLAANAMAASGLDGYLREELAAQVEAMVRAYARRRWRPLLTEFEVLEVEREGEWKLADLRGHSGLIGHAEDGSNCDDYCSHTEIWFASRADALLRERSTSYLYIESFKTTGSWDRRKEQDAQVDMQGLSEAVDIERRLGEAWRLLHAPLFQSLLEDFSLGATLAMSSNVGILELVEPRTAEWLATLPEPPRILGVRYEYLIKGPRRTDKNDAEMPNRYVADTPLIRAYMFAGLTADDRKWAHSYNWHTLAGKSSRLDYRSWKKAPVWRYMTVAQWIDMLDRGEVQAEAYNEQGQTIDILAEQFIPPVTVWRNDDDMRDMLEQLEAEETRTAIDVAAVHAVEGNPAAVRSELNKRFAQSRRSCAFPGKCWAFEICYGPQAMRDNPEASELFTTRVPNHVQELVQIVEAAQ